MQKENRLYIYLPKGELKEKKDEVRRKRGRKGEAFLHKRPFYPARKEKGRAEGDVRVRGSRVREISLEMLQVGPKRKQQGK